MAGIRNLQWKIKIGDLTFTPDSPGNFKGAITLDYNSVGACVGGELTFEGYVPWSPYSALVQVWVGSRRIGLGVVGLATSTISDTGTRTSTVPIMGLHTLDADGLAAISLGSAFPEVGVHDGVVLTGISSPLASTPTTQITTDALGFSKSGTIYSDPPFGETVNAGFQRVFGGNPLASWGVRPDGVRVAGIASGGEALSSGAANVRVQPSNFEMNSYISEFVERPGERWRPSYRSRGVGALMPRHGASISSEEMLGDVQGDAPLSLAKRSFDNNADNTGYLVGTVDLYNLVYNSLNNPNAMNVDYQLQGISVTVQVTFDHPALPEAAPEGWRGQNVVPLGTWQDSTQIQPLSTLADRVARGGGSPLPADMQEMIQAGAFTRFTTTQDPETKVIKDKNADYFANIAAYLNVYAADPEKAPTAADIADHDALVSAFPAYFNATYPPKLAAERQRQWDFYRGQVGVNVTVAEWLTTSSSGGAASAAAQISPIRNTAQPQPPLKPVPPDPIDLAQLEAAVELSEYERAMADYQSNPENFRAYNAQLDLDPRKDPGLLKALYRDVTHLDTGSNRMLTYTFSVPKELIAQLDPSLGANYKWAFGVQFSALRLGLTARGSITATKMYKKAQVGDANVGRDLPDYNKAPLTPGTLQGYVIGEIHTGPFMVDGQQMANARVIIKNTDYRTEFQTGAANRGQGK